MVEVSRAQSDDCYATISFLAQDGTVTRGTVGWREGIENRVVFAVWGGPSFSAEEKSLAMAFSTARAGIIRAGFVPQAPDDGSLADIFAKPNAARPLQWSGTRLLGLLLAVVTIVFVLVTALKANAAVPEHGKRLPFPNAPYDYRYDGPNFDPRDGGKNSAARIRHEARERGEADAEIRALDPVIAILERGSGRVIASYRLEGGQFCDYEDDNCDFDGIFPIVISDMPDEPVLGVVRHVGAYGQKLSILRPLKNRGSPVFEAVADRALSFRLHQDRLDITIDHVSPGGASRLEQLKWPTDVANVPPSTAPSAISLPEPPALSASAAEFEAKLRLITSDRDIDGFMAILTDDVLVSFGGSGGKAEFAEQWRLDTEQGRAIFWETLERLLDHGGWLEAGGKDDDGADYPERLTYPWFFAAWPADAENAFIIEENAPLRAAADDAAPIIDRLNHPTVLQGRIEDGDEALGAGNHGWLEIVAPSGGFAFVRQEDVVPLLEPRILGMQTGEGWRIEAVVSGDG
jgi:hypothetical protein